MSLKRPSIRLKPSSNSGVAMYEKGVMRTVSSGGLDNLTRNRSAILETLRGFAERRKQGRHRDGLR